MSKFRRAIRGAQAGAFAAAGIALAFFVLDLVRLQPLATPGFLSGAVLAPAGLQWDFTGMSDLIAGLETAYMITTFTLLHFLTFALVGGLASVYFDWKHKIGLLPLLAVSRIVRSNTDALVFGFNYLLTWQIRLTTEYRKAFNGLENKLIVGLQFAF